MAAFFPLVRLHNPLSSGLSLSSSPLTALSAQANLSLRYSLLRQFYTYYFSGAPLLRPLFLNFPLETQRLDPPAQGRLLPENYSLMVGDAMLFVVCQPNMTSTTLVLPEHEFFADSLNQQVYRLSSSSPSFTCSEH